MSSEAALARVMAAFPHGLPKGIDFDAALARLKAGRAPKVYAPQRDYSSGGAASTGAAEDRRAIVAARRALVCQWVQAGHSDAEIARVLNISVAMVCEDRAHLRMQGDLDDDVIRRGAR